MRIDANVKAPSQSFRLTPHPAAPKQSIYNAVSGCLRHRLATITFFFDLSKRQKG